MATAPKLLSRSRKQGGGNLPRNPKDLVRPDPEPPDLSNPFEDISEKPAKVAEPTTDELTSRDEVDAMIAKYGVSAVFYALSGSLDALSKKET